MHAGSHRASFFGRDIITLSTSLCLCFGEVTVAEFSDRTLFLLQHDT